MTNAHFQDPPLASRALTDRKAQYAAWRDRLMKRNQVDEIIDLNAPQTPAPWSAEALLGEHAVDG